MTSIPAFKRYDIRGKLGKTLDEDLVRRIGHAFAAELAPRATVIGYDVRQSSPGLAAALAQGVTEGGSDVIDIGLCGTEEVYFATDHFGAGGGLMVTASHNPIDENGIKLVGAGARPLSDATFASLHARVATAGDHGDGASGQITQADPRAAYVDRLLSFVDIPALRPLAILVNPGNGAAGPTFDAIAEALVLRGAPLQFVRHHHDPDSRFPNGIPNPLLPENHAVTGDAVRAAEADFGVAWDGDFDRCFFFDGDGTFVPGEYIVSLLAEAALERAPGATIVHDPRVVFSATDAIETAGGLRRTAPTGHAFMKAAMRDANAVYGGELSAHHYFRDFMYCDSGMIPWMLVASRLSYLGTSLKDVVTDRRARFPSSGEINFRVTDPDEIMAQIEAAFGSGSGSEVETDRLDGLSLTFDSWRLNLRKSNTEALLRLNVETHGDPKLLQDRIAAVTAYIQASA